MLSAIAKLLKVAPVDNVSGFLGSRSSGSMSLEVRGFEQEHEEHGRESKGDKDVDAVQEHR